MRVRDEKWLREVRRIPCLICGRWAQAHHLQHAEPSAMGKRSGDNWAVPLCADHHTALHRFGDEPLWWATEGVDPIKWVGENYGRES